MTVSKWNANVTTPQQRACPPAGPDQPSPQEVSLETAGSPESGGISHAEAAAKLQPDVQGEVQEAFFRC